MADLGDAFDAELGGGLQAKLDAARSERDIARRTAARLEAEAEELRQALGLQSRLAEVQLRPPKWALAKGGKKERFELAAWLHFSDWHFDEVVRPGLMGGVNAYNRAIGEMRLRRWIDKISELVNLSSSFDYKHCHLSVNGDVMSGWIHDLAEANDGEGAFKDVEHWANLLAAALYALAGLFEKVWVTVTIGNHGRLHQKPRSKDSVATNYEYLLGRLLKLSVSDPRIVIDVAESPDVVFPIYDLTVLQTHGNTGHSGSGGNGQAGIWTVVNKIVGSKRAQLAHQGQSFDVVGLGHFHQYKPAALAYDGVIVNGSGKGWDEYARDKGFAPEPACQAFVDVAPGRGITNARPVFVADREAEGW